MAYSKYSESDVFYYNRNADGLDSGDWLEYELGGVYTYVTVMVVASGLTTGVFNISVVTKDGDEVNIGAKDLLTNQEVTELNVTSSNATMYLLLAPNINKLKIIEADSGFDGVLIVEGKKESV